MRGAAVLGRVRRGSLRRTAPRDRAGVTLAELILATGLAPIVVAATVSIVDTTLSLWTRGETVRQAREEAAAVLSILGDDLRQVHGGEQGDLLVDWELFDVERDGVVERLHPRLRFVRDAAASEVARIERRRLASEARAERDRIALAAGDDAAKLAEALSELELLEAAGVSAEQAAQGMLGAPDLRASRLVEVLYAVVPEGREGDRRYTGVLYRAERIHSPDTPPVLLGDDAFDRRGMPDLNLAREVARGVLWMQPLMATQTTRLTPGEDGRSGWGTERSAAGAATSWDAWRLGRPDPDLTFLNEPSPGMPRAGDRPLLPRRVRVTLEIQRPGDFDRAPRLLESAEESAEFFVVTNGAALRPAVGGHVLVAGEWMELKRVTGDRAVVRRATRGTARRRLPMESRVLFGESVEMDIPIALHEDNWRLSAGDDDR